MIGCTTTGAVNDTEAAGIMCPNRIRPPHILIIIQSLNTPVSKVQVELLSALIVNVCKTHMSILASPRLWLLSMHWSTCPDFGGVSCYCQLAHRVDGKEVRVLPKPTDFTTIHLSIRLSPSPTTRHLRFAPD